MTAQRRAAAPLDLVAGDPQILRLLSITALDSLRGQLGELCSVAGETVHTGEICA